MIHELHETHELTRNMLNRTVQLTCGQVRTNVLRCVDVDQLFADSM